MEAVHRIRQAPTQDFCSRRPKEAPRAAWDELELQQWQCRKGVEPEGARKGARGAEGRKKQTEGGKEGALPIRGRGMEGWGGMRQCTARRRAEGCSSLGVDAVVNNANAMREVNTTMTSAAGSTSSSSSGARLSLYRAREGPAKPLRATT